MLAIEIRAARPDDVGVAPLLAALDAYLYQQYPVDEFSQDVNHILSPPELLHPSVTFLAAWRGAEALGCGAIRCITGLTDANDATDSADAYAEIKRMFVSPLARRQRVGEALVTALETQARALGVASVKLETGTRQPEALRLYERCGYHPCALFGDYAPNPVSVFMEKHL